ncbi:hypothetical protein PT076_08820, partial [Erysipelothrix rhusiopathiae]|nr:hypothetical protein [Erysipelothrix rhusiopathiae]
INETSSSFNDRMIAFVSLLFETDFGRRSRLLTTSTTLLFLKAMNDAKLEYDERKDRHKKLNAEVELLTESTYEKNRELADKQQ